MNGGIRVKLRKLYLTNNLCYMTGKNIHRRASWCIPPERTTPRLSRYVGPDDGMLGPNPYNNHWNQPTPGGRKVCPHAFIGKLKDGSIATYQTLPWDMAGWHSGSGSLRLARNANNTGYIGFEICEDGLADPVYFSLVYREAVELAAYLCALYDIRPVRPTSSTTVRDTS